MELQKAKALQSGREIGKKMISSYGLFYITILAGGFIFAAGVLEAEVLSVVSAVVSILVVNITSILANVIKSEEPRDPTEMAMELLNKTIELDHEENK